jgi:glycosyltransferase involved in cell wall biosynthesis
LANSSTFSGPLVSVLTPSYNQGQFLSDCLRSVREQSYPRVEHIVMDGGSTDGSLDVLRQAGDSIHWKSQQDKGQSDALNRAFKHSSGDIIGWVNSDDAYYRPTTIRVVVEAFANHPDVGVVYGHCALVNAEGLLLQVMWAPPFSGELLKFQNFINQPTVFIRRSALKGAFVDETFDYAMDRELWLRLAMSCKFVRVPKILAIDRQHPDRKAETLRHVYALERTRLRERYEGVPDRGGPLPKLWRVATRAWGVSLIPGARRGPFAFSAKSDGLVKLVLRQIATPRRWMPASM